MNNSTSSFYNTLPPAGFCVRTSKYFSMNWLRLYATLIWVLENFLFSKKQWHLSNAVLYYFSWQVQEKMSLKIRRLLLNSDAEIFSFWLSFTRKVHVESQNCWYLPHNSITSDHWNLSVSFLTTDVDILQLMQKVMCEVSSTKAVSFLSVLLKALAKKRKSFFFFSLAVKCCKQRLYWC